MFSFIFRMSGHLFFLGGMVPINIGTACNASPPCCECTVCIGGHQMFAIIASVLAWLVWSPSKKPWGLAIRLWWTPVAMNYSQCFSRCSVLAWGSTLNNPTRSAQSRHSPGRIRPDHCHHIQRWSLCFVWTEMRPKLLLNTSRRTHFII